MCRSGGDLRLEGEPDIVPLYDGGVTDVISDSDGHERSQVTKYTPES